MSLTGTKLAAAVASLAVDLSDLVEADQVEAEGEAGDRLFHSARCRGSDLGGLADGTKRAQLSALAPDLKGVGHIAIRLGHEPQGEVVVYVGEPPHGASQQPSTDLTTFAAALAAQARTPYTVDVFVDKIALATKIAGEEVGRDRRLYLFAQAVTGILATGSESAASLWREPAKPIVIAVLDGAEIDATGKLLRLVGGSKVTSEALTSVPTGQDTSRVSRCRRDQVAWAREWSHAVTPLHYHVEFSAGSDSTVASALAGQIAKLTVLHVCDRARIAAPDQPTVITVDFRGGSHAASLQLDDRNTTRPWNKVEVASLTKLVEWIYRAPTEGARDWMFDRLQFAQITIARMLEIVQSTHAKAALDGFVRITNGLARRLEHQWETYVEGKLDDYAAKVAEVEQVATDAVSKYNERVAAIVKSVADAALAAVAVMVGTFIAAAFKTPFNSELFEIGLTVYAGYVFVFPFLWGQASHAYQKRQVTRAHEARLGQLRTVLGDAVDDNVVVATAKVTSGTFWAWWVLACLVYLGLVASAVVAIDIVPDRIVNKGAATTVAPQSHRSLSYPGSIPRPDLSSRPLQVNCAYTVNARPEEVFAAWTTRFDTWFAQPGTLAMVPEPGRPYFFYNRDAWGRHPHYGRFLDVEENRASTSRRGTRRRPRGPFGRAR